MARKFTSASEYFTLADDAALTLPNGDWSLGGWFKITNNAGIYQQWFFNWNAYSRPYLYAFVFEASAASGANEIKIGVHDGTNFTLLTGTSTPGTSTAWQHLLLVRSGNTITQYIDGAADGSSNTSITAVDAGVDLHMGGRGVGETNYNFLGELAGWAKWDRALSTAERAGLAAGASAAHYPLSLAWNMPMRGDLIENKSFIAVTNNGTTVSAHPTIATPLNIPTIQPALQPTLAW